MKIKELFAVSILAWATLPLNGIFNPEDGFVGCDRQEKFYPLDGRKRKKRKPQSMLGVLSGGDVSLHKVEVHTVVGLLGLGGVLLLLLNDQGEVGMLGNLLGQFLVDGAEALACLVKTGFGADDLILDEVDGETDGVLLHNVSFLVPFGTVAVIREPYPLII